MNRRPDPSRSLVRSGVGLHDLREWHLLVDRSEPTRPRLVTIHRCYTEALQAHEKCVSARVGSERLKVVTGPAKLAGEALQAHLEAARTRYSTDYAVRSITDPRYASLVAVFLGPRQGWLDAHQARRIVEPAGYAGQGGGWVYRLGAIRNRPLVQGWRSALAILTRRGVIVERIIRDDPHGPGIVAYVVPAVALVEEVPA